MKALKKAVALMLCVVMTLGIFAVSGITIDDLAGLFPKAKAANITLTDGDWGITQQRIITDYEDIYKEYQTRFFAGAHSNEPTNFVIPGLASSDYYTPQGMTYWAEKEWILISAYDASGNKKNSVIYALDASTTEFVALFKIKNVDGSVNTSHGGGIAASQYNFYYADSGSLISYIPLSEMDVEPGTVKTIQLYDSIDCSGELGGASTSYCCYDDGVLWAGNFYYSGSDDYKKSAHSSYDSMLVGYKLKGSSSEEEWFYLQDKNLINPYVGTATGALGAMSITTSVDEDGYIDISGSVTASSAGEDYYTFGTATLLAGVSYTLEFDISGDSLPFDFFFLRDGGTDCCMHMNYLSNQNFSYYQNADGTYHGILKFTPGVAIAGSGANWQNSTDASGTYHIRFDQDNVANDHSVSLQNIRIYEDIVNPNGNATSTQDCAGNPTHVVMFDGFDKVQYAMVDKGKIYISRSWKRISETNHTRELMIADIDINSPGTISATVNGRTRSCHVTSYSSGTHFGGDYGAGLALQQMFYMGEALCVIEDNLYMFGEGAAYKYYGAESSVCEEPIDVIWKIDHHAIMEEYQNEDDSVASYYEKVNSLDEIDGDDQYIIVYESSEKNSLTQQNILYAIDSYGNYNGYKLPKTDVSSQQYTGDAMGIIGYKITDYSMDGNKLYISEEDDARDSIRWKIKINDDSTVRIQNMDLYYATYKYLYFGSRLFAMSTDSRSALDNLRIDNPASGNFRFYYQGGSNYYMWCNDGLDETLNNTYTSYYANHGKTGYIPVYDNATEVAGTFHMDAEYLRGSAADSGNLTQADLGGDCQIMNIYKRVYDPYTSTYETNIYTDMSATLASDGTYTIDLETYATGERQFQKVDERPTDFIFVLDASGSMDNTDDPVTGYIRYNGTLSSYSVAGKTTAVGDNSETTGACSDIYYQHSDGTYCLLYVDSSARKGSWLSYYMYVWLYYTHEGTTYYYNGTDWQTTKPETGIKASGNSDADRADATIYTGVHYRLGDDCNKLNTMQNTVDQLTYKIAEKASETGLDHRISLVTFGSDADDSNSSAYLNSGIYTNTGSYVQYDNVTASNYANAFHSVSSFSTFRNSLFSITVGTDDPDTYSNLGFKLANGIIDNSDSTYDGEGNRSVCIIMITDGVPGVGGDDYTEANIVANEAIAAAYDAKCNNGAYIYSVQIGTNTMEGFNMDAYMDYVSSEFVYATSMNTPGARNNKDIAYRVDVPTGTSFDLYEITKEIFTSVTSNSTNAIAHLDADSILREHITDAFIIPDDITITAKYAQATRDGIGRLIFEDPVTASGVTATQSSTDNNVIDITGYDYSSEYISKSHNGRKLIITIEGILPNESVDLKNTSINETSTTAIYQDSTYLSKGIAVKKFPTESFSIPEYTFVMDYDMPMYDAEVNGTLCSVDSTLQKQSTYKTSLDTDTMGIDFANSNQDLVYTLNSRGGQTAQSQKGYVLIKRDDGTYDWFRLNILPASTVYYEESSLDTKSSSGYVSWSQNGTTTSSYQQTSTDNDVYGNDPAYSQNTSNFSLGTHMEATVTASNKRSETKTFTFTGTGFDLISACGTNTGIQTVTVKKDGSIVKTFITDTYYNDTTYGTVYQVPIVHYEGEYGTYTVESTAAYLSFAGGVTHETVSTNSVDGTEIETQSAPIDSLTADEIFAELDMDELIGTQAELVWMDDNSIFNGGTGAEGSNLSTQSGEGSVSLVNYIDGFRIYNPLDDDSSYPSNEQNASYYSVIDAITSGNISGDSLAAYIEPGASGEINFSNYLTSGGPKHEVFLAPGNAIAFRFIADCDTNPHAMIGVRAASGSPTCKFGVTDSTTTYSFGVVSASETYYDITNYLGVDSGYFTLTIQNTGTGILAVDNIKVTNATLVATSSANLAEISEIMTMSTTEIDAATLSVAATASKYPDYVPDPNLGNLDPDLDVEGELPSAPSTNENTNSSTSVIDTLISLLQSLLAKIISFIRTVFTAVSAFFKEV